MRFSSKFAGISVAAGSAFLALAACGPSKDHSAPTSAGNPAANEPAYVPAMLREMTQAMKDNAVPGLVILVRSPKGDWARVLGTAEIGVNKPWTLNDHFRIGSNTKTMTGTVILQLAQEGKL